jgi:hypothetical protein
MAAAGSGLHVAREGLLTAGLVEMVVVVTAGSTIEVEGGTVVVAAARGWTMTGGRGVLDPAVIGFVLVVVVVGCAFTAVVVVVGTTLVVVVVGTALRVVVVVGAVGIGAVGIGTEVGVGVRPPRREAEGVGAGLPSRAMALTVGMSIQITAEVSTVSSTPVRNTCCPARRADIALHTVRQERHSPDDVGQLI